MKRLRLRIKEREEREAAPRGYLMLTALVFGAVFLVVFGALSSFVLTENRAETANAGKSKALSLAEAGLEYYKWFLAHNPGNTTNGTAHTGPYVTNYSDPEGGVAGTYALSVVGNQSCGQTTSIDITSKGTPNDGSGTSRTVTARYAQPTVAQYAYVLNDSVWAGSDRVIYGPYHSNGGIRMDGTANAPVTSSLSTWTCTSSFGCGTNTTVSGVFGVGPNQSLWDYPTPQVDFSAISANFSSLKSTAQSQGKYLGRISTGTTVASSNYNKGYHLVFNSNGTVTVYKVNSETDVPSIPVDNQSVTSPTDDFTLINSESSYQIWTLPSTCGLIYVEDNVWIEGTITGKVTVVAANVVNTGVNPNVMLPDNITYANSSAGLTVLSENDVLITPDSPQNMTLNGIFIAQGGAFGRNYYGYNSCPNSYEPRGSLTIHGTTVSNKRTGTKWLNGCGSSAAGYQSRTDAYDRMLANDPPAFTPNTSTDYQFVDWRQQ